MKKKCLTVISAIVLLGSQNPVEWAQTTQSLFAESYGNEVLMHSGGWRMLTPEERADPKMKAHDMSGKLPKLKTQPPSDWDWRNVNGKNWMTSVKDQYAPVGGCDCCWAFAAVGMLEARYKIANDIPDDSTNPNLSEQFMVSCETRCSGCGGGATEYAMEFLATTGVPDEACYPYEAHDYNSGALCSEACPDWESRVVKGVDYNWSYDSLDYKARVMEGPVAAGGAMKLGHAMVLCGWNSSGQWLYKNSWGSNQSYVWRDNAPRMIGWVTVKSDTGTPIIWTTDSLNFVFEQKGMSSTNTSPREIILEPSLVEKFKGDEDTLKSDDGIQSPWLQGVEDWAVRFTPPQKCNVIAGLIMRKTSQVENDKLIVRDDAGGVPGTTIEMISYATQAVVAPKWYRQNLSVFYQDENDFWLTYKCKTNPSTSFIGGDAAGGANSFISFDGGYEWLNMTPYFSSDLMIRAVVTYEGGVGSETIWVKNTEAGKLTVTDVHSAQSSNWIVGISPKSFSVYYDDSVGIRVCVDTVGLQVDFPHQDEIVITSNSGKAEIKVPVTLIIKSGGIAEETASTLTTFKLSPNPFRGKVGISYFVPEKTNVKLIVRDITGREIAEIVNKIENTGIKKIDWNTKDIPSGVYFCRLAIGDSEITRKVLLIR